MAAGLGFKTFTTGEVLTAADTNGYLMQGINVFASTAARDAAITSPQEGQFAYTKDTNSLWYYTGSAWAASGATGDIEGVTAGVGISGGGTSGTVTITNSMATEIAAKGDLIVGTGAATFDNLTVGANGTTLVADSAEATGLKWATPAAGGGMTLLSTTTLSGASVTISSIPGTYVDLVMYLVNYKPSADTDYPLVQFNSDATANRYANKISNYTTNQTFGSDSFPLMQEGGNDNSVATGLNVTRIPYYANTTTWKMANTMDLAVNGTTTTNYNHSFAYSYYNQTTAISSLKILANSGTMTSGTIYLYGVK